MEIPDKIFAAALLFAAAWHVSTFGQTLGEITGEIRDTSGGTVAGAAVTLTNRTTGVARTVLTNQVGVYSFPSFFAARSL